MRKVVSVKREVIEETELARSQGLAAKRELK